MIEAASILISKAIGFVVGITTIFIGFLFVGQQTNNINFDRHGAGTTTVVVAENIIKTETEQTQEENTIVDKEKEKKQIQINQLEKLVEETNILTKQFSAL